VVADLLVTLLMFACMSLGAVALLMVGIAALFLLSRSLNEQRKAAREAWQAAADEFGWYHLGGRGHHYEGTTSGGHSYTVRTRRVRKRKNDYENWIELTLPDVAPAGELESEAAVRWNNDVRTGHKAFDDLARIDMRPEQLVRLGHRFQTAYLAARRQHVHTRIRDGHLTARLQSTFPSLATLRGLVEHATALCESIGRGDVTDLLVEEVRHAPYPRHRARCLQQLFDRDPERAVASARDLGPPVALDDHVAIVVHRLLGEHDQVLSRLPEHLDPRERAAILLQLLQSAPPDVAQAALAMATTTLLDKRQAWLLTELAATPPRPELTSALLAHREALSGAALRAWCDLWRHWPADDDVRAALAACLGHADDELGTAAAVALRQVGTVAEVPALRRAAEGEGLLGSGTKVAACKQAVAAIQERASADRGQLSIADPGRAGRLSLAKASARESQG
jgi:hypothetical protein